MKTAKKITKKEIKEILKSENRTEIFKLVFRLGIKPTHSNVCKFIRDNAHADYVYNAAYNIAYCGNHKHQNNRNRQTKIIKLPIHDALMCAIGQKKQGMDSYSKILFEGNKNIYFCHPGYGHSDYNKWVAFPNEEKYRRVAMLVNSYLGYKFN